MAARRAKRKPAKKETKKAFRAKVVRDASIGKASGPKRQAAAVVIFALSLLLVFLVLIPGRNVWAFLHGVLFGLFGIGTFGWPILLLYIALSVAFERPFASLTAKLWEAAGLIVCFCAAVQVFAVGPISLGGEYSLAAIYTRGVALTSGGAAGGLIGGPLYNLCGRAGAGVTVLLLLFVCFVLVSGLTLRQVLSVFIPKLRREGNAADEPADKIEPVFFKHKKPRFNINIDLGPDVPMPDHPVQSPRSEPPKKEKKKPDVSLDALVSRVTKSEPPASGAAKQAELPSPDRGEQQTFYNRPPLTLLRPPAAVSEEDVSEELRANAGRLVDTLRSFGVETRIINISRGPAVTRYELQPSAGVKISRITSLADDIALNLAAAGVRIEAPIPNKAAVGIEVPNKVVSVVSLREILETREFREAPGKLSVALGRDIAGNPAVADIAKMPHVLIAGATGSGKSVCINSIIMSILFKSDPEEVRFLLVDPKVVELSVYNGIPQLLVPVVTDPRKAAGALNWAVTEMLNRYKAFADNNVRDIRGYNALARKNTELAPMPQIVIIIDELADLMMAAPSEVEDAICRLAQMARAAGMHLVVATQRPSVDVITGVIKANIPTRIAFAVSSQVDSRTILDGGGAEKLLGRGDMLFLPVGAAKPVRVQGCFVTDAEVEAACEFIRKNGDSEYSDDIMDEIEKQAAKKKDGASGENEGGDNDEMLPAAIECVVEAGMASTSLLQRRLKLGYARAARIVDQMEARGIVGPFEGSKPRQVLLTKQQFLEMQLAKRD